MKRHMDWSSGRKQWVKGIGTTGIVLLALLMGLITGGMSTEVMGGRAGADQDRLYRPVYGKLCPDGHGHVGRFQDVFE